MKHRTVSLKPFVFALAALLFVSTAAFAGEAVPGVGVGGKKNPCCPQFAKTKTDENGKFTFSQFDTGSYTITVTADEVKNMKAVAARVYASKFKGESVRGITISIAQSEGMLVNGKRQWGPITLSATKTNKINITLSKEGTISGSIMTADTSK